MLSTDTPPSRLPSFNSIDKQLHNFLAFNIPDDWDLVPFDYDEYPWSDPYEPDDTSLVDINDYNFDLEEYNYQHSTAWGAHQAYDLYEAY